MSKVSDKQIELMREVSRESILLDHVAKFMYELNKAFKDFEVDVFDFLGEDKDKIEALRPDDEEDNLPM